jgi:hypothetical protein
VQDGIAAVQYAALAVGIGPLKIALDAHHEATADLPIVSRLQPRQPALRAKVERFGSDGREGSPQTPKKCISNGRVGDILSGRDAEISADIKSGPTARQWRRCRGSTAANRQRLGRHRKLRHTGRSARHGWCPMGRQLFVQFRVLFLKRRDAGLEFVGGLRGGGHRSRDQDTGNYDLCERDIHGAPTAHSMSFSENT